MRRAFLFLCIIFHKMHVLYVIDYIEEKGGEQTTVNYSTFVLYIHWVTEKAGNEVLFNWICIVCLKVFLESSQ